MYAFGYHKVVITFGLIALRINRTSTQLHNIWPSGFAYQ